MPFRCFSVHRHNSLSGVREYISAVMCEFGCNVLFIKQGYMEKLLFAIPFYKEANEGVGRNGSDLKVCLQILNL